MTKFADIIERLEKATGPDRDVDRDIHSELDGWEKVWNEQYQFFQLWKDGKWIGLGSIPAYTSSIDAAIALVERMLPGWYWRLGRTSLFPNGWAFIAKYAPDHCDRCDEFAAADGKASSPAIALLLALFRALEAKEGG